MGFERMTTAEHCAKVMDLCEELFDLFAGGCYAAFESAREFHDGSPCEMCLSEGTDDCPVAIAKRMRELGMDVDFYRPRFD